MVGVALVAFVAIFVNGFKASFSGAFEKAVTADFVVLDRSGLTPEAVAPAAARLDERGRRGEPPRRPGQARVGRRRQPRRPRPEARDRRSSRSTGSRAPTTRCARSARGTRCSRSTGRRSARCASGRPFVLRNPEREPVRLTVRGTYEDRGQLFGDVLVPDATLRERFGARTVLAALIASAPGASEDQVRAELAGLLDRDFPTLEPQTRDGVHRLAGRPGQPDPLRLLRAARAVGDHRPVRHRQHARAVGLRAHARARAAARRRHLAPPDPADRPRRGDHHGGDGRGARRRDRRPVRRARLAAARAARASSWRCPYATLVVLLVLGALAGVLAAIAPGPARQPDRRPGGAHPPVIAAP